MITTYESPDDMPPEMRAYCEQLRQRAEAQGCRCRPEITVDTVKCTTVVEHHPGCPALEYPSTSSLHN
jgi:hypothetical protein